MPTSEVASWIAAGTPPIYFGFGSTPIQSPADTIAMIAAACSGAGRTGLDLFRRERLQLHLTF